MKQQQLKNCFFHASKLIGLFHLARFLTRNKLRILCYHAFALDDEDKWLPGLFMKPETFKRRLDYLSRKKFSVQPLEEAIRRLDDRTLPAHATVITIDDGFYSAYRHALPALMKRCFPATLYLTSYYFEKQSPIFNLAVNYMFWKTKMLKVDFSDLDILELDKSGDTVLQGRNRQKIKKAIQKQGDKIDAHNRNILLSKLGGALNVDYTSLVESRKLSLINKDELHETVQKGIDIQLHTHRHRFPPAHDLALKEIADNRAVIEPLLGHPMQHFCYPSGYWSKERWPVLRQAGIKTATIGAAENRFISKQTHKYALPRIVDSGQRSQIAFEAEICGYTDLLRQARHCLKRMLGRE